MNALIFYLGAVALCGLSVILIRQTSTYSLSEGPIKYEPVTRSGRANMCVFVGRILLVIAALAAGMGVLAQFRGLMIGLS